MTERATAPHEPLNGRTIVITGSTDGIGRATALALVRRGARVIVMGRDPRRTADVATELSAEGRAAGGEAEPLAGDLGSLAAVRRVAGELAVRCPRLDVLVHNAGAIFWSREETVDGHERTLALNHLAPFLLTSLLEPRLRASAGARVVVVSSRMHQRADISYLDDLESRRGYSALRAYAASKLMNLHFTFELARRLADSGVTANAVHPGLVRSSFGRAGGGLGPVGFALLTRLFGRTPEEGARTLVHVAAAADLAGVTGRFFGSEREQQPSAAALDRAAWSRLWAESERLVGA